MKALPVKMLTELLVAIRNQLALTSVQRQRLLHKKLALPRRRSTLPPRIFSKGPDDLRRGVDLDMQQLIDFCRLRSCMFHGGHILVLLYYYVKASLKFFSMALE